jgi:poly-gamma-glutamate capsule biosynthesis protein CapA/YwtB (metallophosphatase superfamily)
MQKSFLFVLTATLFIGAGICCAGSEVKVAAPVKKDTTAPAADSNRILKIMAAGDIMFGSNFPSVSGLPPNDGKDLLAAADSLLKHSDITFGNVEGTFLNSGGKPKGSGNNVYCFRQPVTYANYFKESGFDLLSIANNHINDFGAEGINSTESTLSEMGLAFAGTPDHPKTIIERDGLKIGFTAFAPHSGCLSFHDLPAAVKLVKELKKECAIVIVSFHAGAEGKGAQHVPRKKEIFLGQDRGDVYQFAHAMVDAGADMVIGHGPHVARALELYQSRLIAYSLGNFCTYGQFSLSGISGYAPLLEARMNTKGEFVDGKIHSFMQLGEGGPVVDQERNAARTIAALTKTDFQNTELVISEEGKIERRNRLILNK